MERRLRRPMAQLVASAVAASTVRVRVIAAVAIAVARIWVVATVVAASPASPASSSAPEPSD